MSTIDTMINPTRAAHRRTIWLIGVSFVLFQFFLQLSSGVVIGTIMDNMSLSALTAGLLSSAFYIVYTGLQVPVGILFDHKNTRRLLTINVLLCSLGCFIFSESYGLPGLFLGRLLMGSGSAFAFIGLSHLLREHYPLRQFAFMIGLSETLGFIATVIGMIALGSLVTQFGWRGFIRGAGIMGLVIGYCSWTFVPNHTPSQSINHRQIIQQLRPLLTNKIAWINGFFVGLCFTVVTAFGALWAVPFIEVKLACKVLDASAITAAFFLGTAIGCPLFGYLSTVLKHRKPLMLTSCISTEILILILLYTPSHSYLVISFLMFMIGLCCGAYMLAYTIANEIAPPGALSTSTGFTNMLAVITTPLLQPLIGYFLDLSNTTTQYTNHDYQHALLAIPGSLFIASILVYFLPEKNK